MILALLALVVLGLTTYSYALVDPNLTLLSHPAWTVFRNNIITIGYFQRQLSFMLYVSLLILLFFAQYYIVAKKTIGPVRVALLIGACVLLSYPFLSHDFFNYLFDAKIITYYHQNPYLHKALDFPSDPWLRFMHWTHRNYPYGPTFLLITILPSFVSAGKFILSFLFFKSVWVGLYVCAVYFLGKFDKKTALFFALSPLIIIEGLVNAHNDMIALSLGIIALGFFELKKPFLSFLSMVLSVGIKYTTAPFVLLYFKKPWALIASIGIYFIGILYLSTKTGLYPWYFLNLFLILIYVKQKAFIPLTILSIFLLLSYHPYIALGFWNKSEYLMIKDGIIVCGMFVAGVSVLFLSMKRRSVSD